MFLTKLVITTGYEKVDVNEPPAWKPILCTPDLTRNPCAVDMNEEEYKGK